MSDIESQADAAALRVRGLTPQIDASQSANETIGIRPAKDEKHSSGDVKSSNAPSVVDDANMQQIRRTKSRSSAVLRNISSHLTTHSLPPPGPPPDGGTQAWLQCFCAFLTVMTTWGFVNSFGAFQTYYEATLPESRSTISWIGSVQASFNFFISAFSGRALDAGYFRPTFILGVAIQVLGIFTMSASSKYWQLLITQGVLAGIGGGLFFCPSLGLLATYFEKRRAMAIGLATTGNAVGGIIYPLVVRQLIPQIGFPWTARVLGFINLAVLSFAAVFMKPRLPPRKSGPIFEITALKDTPYVIFTLGACFYMAALYFPFFYTGSFARDIIGLPFNDSLTLLIALNAVGIPFRILPGILASTWVGVINIYSGFLLCNSIILFFWLTFCPGSSITGFYVWVIFYGATTAGFQSIWAAALSTLHSDISKTGTRLGMAFSVIGVAALVGGPIAGALIKADGGTYLAPRIWAAVTTLMGASLTIWVRGSKFGWGWIRC